MSANWTIMVYISADDVLANFAIESLKQLKNAANERVAVVSAFDTNQKDKDTCIYFFDGKAPNTNTGDGPLEPEKPEQIKHLTILHSNPVDMSRPETLSEFINYASQKSQTKRYCLILWGHGTELLLDEERRQEAGDNESQQEVVDHAPLRAMPELSVLEMKRAQRASNGPVRRYLTPANLRKALLNTKLAQGDLGENHPKSIFEREKAIEAGLAPTKARHALDIIAIDACSMNMVEVASELADHVDFMVASQGDVPDESFPYQQILKDLRGHEDVKELSAMIPKVYNDAFQDYIATPGNGLREITLSSLDLSKIGTIAEPITKLATSLRNSVSDRTVRDAILAARKRSQGFVFGIFVDLFDYCQKLSEELIRKKIVNEALTSACMEIRNAIEVGSNGCIIANATGAKGNDSCHGISIYFPYRVEDERDNFEERLTKGGTRYPLKERSVRIKELEEDFAVLKFKDTGWTQFIKLGWSWILAEQNPPELDKHYSAEQCASNYISLYQGLEPPKAKRVA